MRRRLVLISILLFTLSAFAKSDKSLQIYFIDVEGGQATLIVSPSGQSMLIDTGWPGERDSGRIAAAAKAAGVTKLDYVLLTHFHLDHTGGVPDLVKQIPVDTFVDHGANVETTDDTTTKVYAAYEKVMSRAKHIVLKPGEGLPFHGITVRAIASAGQHIPQALANAGTANSLCAAEPKPEVDDGENAQSLGVLITFGKFTFLDLGDLTKKKELELACPNNMIGTVDLLLVEHHGGDSSNPKALVWALHPRAAVIDNGPHKGGAPAAWQIVHDSPGLETLWQLHYAEDAGKDHNVPEDFLANLPGGADGGFFKATAEEDRTFTITNSRNNLTKTYKK